MKLINKFWGIILGCIMATQGVFAASETAMAEFTINLSAFVSIKSISSPVLTANITDRTGDLRVPLSSTFRVITNHPDTTTLYLKAKTITDGGYEEAMFDRGGQVYIAFGNLRRLPSTSALNACKIGSSPKDSPGVVAYPVTSVFGAKNQYISGEGKYEVYVPNGTTDVTVNIGASVLRDSFSSNDPRGFYQAVLSLTEADI